MQIAVAPWPQHAACMPVGSYGSQLRSLSQSSQGSRVEVVGLRYGHAQSLRVLQDRGCTSPRLATSRRASSYMHLQATGSPGGHAFKSGSGQGDASMSSLRSSLLQHIQVVQKEISRLQLERQRSQQSCKEWPQDTGRPQTGRKESRTSAASTVAAPAAAAGGASPLERHSVGSGPPVSRAHRELPADRLDGSWSSRSGRNLQQRSCRSSSAHHSGQPHSQLETPRINARAISPGCVAVSFRGEPSKRVASTACTVSASPPPLVPGGIDVLAAVRAAAASRIQCAWRARLVQRARRLAGQQPQASLSSCVRRPSSVLRRQADGRLIAVHWAAGRIQRAWKIHRWRRRFVDFSERQLRWVGSLEWLQQQNMLYGTELADSEDVRWWLQQRTTAPLDREVDPWGSERLVEHLHRMWYGGRTVEPDEPAQQQVRREHRPSQPHVQQPHYQQRLQQQREQSTLSRRARETHRRSSCGPSMVGEVALAGSEPAAGSARPTRGIASARCSVAGLASGAPPPSAAAAAGVLQKAALRMPSGSPPQTHRAPRATVAGCSPLGVVALRPRSPLQSARSHTTTSPIASRPGAAGLASAVGPPAAPQTARTFGHVQRSASGMSRTFSGSSPLAFAARSPTSALTWR